MEPNLNNSGLLPSAMALKYSLSSQARYLTRGDDALSISARVVAAVRKWDWRVSCPIVTSGRVSFASKRHDFVRGSATRI